MPKKIDLHVHTKASDGLFTPSEIIDYARNNDITSLAICDHDTVDGIPEAIKYAGSIGFELVPGVEFGLDHPDGSLHVVGLFIDHNHKPLLEASDYLKKSRISRNLQMVKLLREEGYDISLEEVEKEAAGAAMGKPHIARVLIRKGFVKDPGNIFKDFMCRGKPGFVQRERIKPEEAISCINDSGGISILAHPVSLNYKSMDMFERKLDELINYGLDGIEAYSSMHTMNDVNEYLKIAEKKKLIVSGGSDYHGDKGKKIGVYTENEFIPDHILDNLKRYRERNR